MMRLRNLLRPKTLWRVQKRLIGDLVEDAPKERQIKIKTPLRKQLSKVELPMYGGRYVVTMLTGTGLGPELMVYVKDVFRHAHIPVDFEDVQASTMDEVDDAIVSIRRNKTALKSHVDPTPEGDPNVYIRQNLDLYLSLVHCKPYCHLGQARHTDVDIILMRQNTEGEYAMLEHENMKGVVESMKIITRVNSERVARRTFDYASVHQRKKVTVVHKANIMKLSDGLFLREAQKMAANYPHLQQDQMLVDNLSMQLVSKPKQFDVLMMPNLYGSIVANIMCGILGGAGLFAGCNFGEQFAMFEPAARKTGKSLVGKNIANPVSMLNAAVELLYHLGLAKSANLLDKAIYKTICRDMVQTPDIGGKNSSTDVVEKIKENYDIFLHYEKKRK